MISYKHLVLITIKYYNKPEAMWFIDDPEQVQALKLQQLYTRF